MAVTDLTIVWIIVEFAKGLVTNDYFFSIYFLF